MKIKNIIISLVLMGFGCSKNKDLELEIVTKEIKAIDLKSISVNEYYNNIEIVNKSKTIVNYKLTNNTDKTFFFNLNGYNEKFEKKFMRMDRAFIDITDENKLSVKHKSSFPTFGSKLPKDFEILNQLDYSYLYRFNNFIIHPHETLYFEWFLMLPLGNQIELKNSRVNFDPNKKYFAEILLNSDSTNYKRYISRTELQTIKENGYEVYHGTLKSKNKIPIKFVNLQEK